MDPLQHRPSAVDLHVWESLGYSALFFFFFLSFFKWLVLFIFGCTACKVLVPSPGTEPMPPSVEAQSPNHGTWREFPWVFCS